MPDRRHIYVWLMYISRGKALRYNYVVPESYDKSCEPILIQSLDILR